jgi:hypothetical protein
MARTTKHRTLCIVVAAAGIAAMARGQLFPPPTSPDCPADINGDDTVDVLDLVAVITAWGESAVPEDINGDGIVDVLDLLEVITAWGPCCVCTNSGGAECGVSTYLGTVCGDDGSDTVTVDGCGAGWFEVFLEECSEWQIDLQMRITLQMTAGDDYDLYVYEPCGTLRASSTGPPGAPEQASITVPDLLFTDDSRYVFVEVVEAVADPCEQWSLLVEGNVMK